MLVAPLQLQRSTAIRLLLQQATIRHASKTTRNTSKKSTKAVKKADRNPTSGTSSSTGTGSSSSSSGRSSNSSTVNDAAVGERYVTEKVIYEMGPNERVADARLLLGFGLMFCIFCINGADIVRREPRQPTDPEAPRVESWPAWKRWGAAGCFATIGLGIGAYCIYWPTRILKRITLIAPSTNPSIQIPTVRLQKGGIPSTPYQQCKVKFTTSASELIPRIFKAPLVDFTQLRLLGPLSSQKKWYHPKNSDAFGEKAMKGGKLPSNVPLAIEGTKIIYNIRKAGGIFSDLEGLERALLMNDPKTRVEEPKAVPEALKA